MFKAKGSDPEGRSCVRVMNGCACIQLAAKQGRAMVKRNPSPAADQMEVRYAKTFDQVAWFGMENEGIAGFYVGSVIYNRLF